MTRLSITFLGLRAKVREMMPSKWSESERTIWKSQHSESETERRRRKRVRGWQNVVECIESLFISCFEFPFQWIEDGWFHKINENSIFDWLNPISRKYYHSIETTASFTTVSIVILMFSLFLFRVVCVCAGTAQHSTSVHRAFAVCFWLLLCLSIKCVYQIFMCNRKVLSGNGRKWTLFTKCT